MPTTTITTNRAGGTQTTTVVVGNRKATTVIVRSPVGDEEGAPPPPVVCSAAAIQDERHGFCVPYEVRQSSIAGLGIFATEPISRGTLIWKYSAKIVKEHPDEASLLASLDSLPSDAERLELLEHVYGWNGCIHEILDDGKYWNHGTLEKGQNTGDHPDGSPPGDGVSSYALCEYSQRLLALDSDDLLRPDGKFSVHIHQQHLQRVWLSLARTSAYCKGASLTCSRLTGSQVISRREQSCWTTIRAMMSCRGLNLCVHSTELHRATL
eukprot:COSAG02_NODE_142_length_34188_cov_183.180791_5_plen_267_part_00